MNYHEMEKQHRQTVEAWWDNTHGPVKSQQDRNAKHQHLREQHVQWFYSTELYSSIDVRHDRAVEIQDLFYGSSITVYPPSRDFEFTGANGERKVIVHPAYINASTWNTGRDDIQGIQRHTKHYLKMMEIALDFQNEMNQAIIEWENLENPLRDAPYYKQEFKNMCERERARKAEEDAKRAARQAKKIPTADSSSQTS